jgi:SAM-dependent methyltransferase
MSKSIEETVRDKYAAVAASTLTGESSGVHAVAEAFGYSAEELASIPAEANMGLSCGNPTATANLRPGEVVVDLGSGGGLDVFLAAKKVGPTGGAIGIDMTDEMLNRARQNAEKAGASNVEFHKATIDDLPLSDGSADCIISNCVINLAPDKRAVFREMARVLKPGARLAVSDIALKKSLPPEIEGDVMAYVGCIAGAIRIEEYREGLKAAGFAHVDIIDSGADLNAYAQIEGQVGCCCGETTSEPVTIGSSACCTSTEPVAIGDACCSPSESKTPELLARLAELVRRHDINDYAASVKVFAVKPR